MVEESWSLFLPSRAYFLYKNRKMFCSLASIYSLLEMCITTSKAIKLEGQAVEINTSLESER